MLRMKLSLILVVIPLTASLKSTNLYHTCGRFQLLRRMSSMTGVIYSGPPDKPVVRLFTKDGCTLCDQAKAVLSEAVSERPHTLESVDITDPEHTEWLDKYKYDIPVLHLNGMYWAKHRITLEESLEALAAVESGVFESPWGEPKSDFM